MFGARQLSLTVIRNRLLHDAQHRADPNLENTIVLVELTGIEPVASWLQTRRSPS